MWQFCDLKSSLSVNSFLIGPVIEEKTISGAAEKLGYTPSGISRMIAGLEAELGFTLLLRGKKGVRPSNECTVMLPSIRNLIHAADECEQMASGIRGLETGTVTIGTAYSMYYRWLSACVSDFHKKYPGIQIELSSGYSTELVNKVEMHELDFCIVTKRDNVDGWIPVCKDHMVALIPLEHPLAEQKTVPLSVFETESYIDSNPDFETDNEIVFRKNGIRPNIQMSSKDSLASWQMVEAGLGIGMNSYLSSCEMKGNVCLVPITPEQQLEIGIAYNNSLTLAGRIFLKTMQTEYLQKLEYLK